MIRRYYEKKRSVFSPWIKEIPDTWELLKARRIFEQKRTSANEFDEQLTASQKYGVIPQKMFMELEDQKVVLALKGIENFKHVDVDDFVISLRSFQGGIEHSKFSGCVSPAYTVLKPQKNIFPKYFSYLLKSNDYIHVLQSVTDGIREGKNISYDQFGGIDLPVPPINEQISIANFLDHETVNIDGLIAKQVRLISLLNEKRESVLSETLLRGVDKKVKLVYSGSELIGFVPCHWSTKRLKYFLSINPSHKENGDIDGSLPTPFFAMESIGDDGILLSGNEKSYGEASNSYTYFKNGDVIVAKVTPCFENGKGALVEGLEPGFGFGTTELVVLRPKEALDSEYLYYVTISREIRYSGVAHMTGAGGLKRVPDDFYLNLIWPIPPLEEQLYMVKFLRNQLGKIDLLINKSRHSIELLKEHRASLISSAVTGKIMVTE